MVLRSYPPWWRQTRRVQDLTRRRLHREELQQLRIKESPQRKKFSCKAKRIVSLRRTLQQMWLPKSRQALKKRLRKNRKQQKRSQSTNSLSTEQSWTKSSRTARCWKIGTKRLTICTTGSIKRKARPSISCWTVQRYAALSSARSPWIKPSRTSNSDCKFDTDSEE